MWKSATTFRFALFQSERSFQLHESVDPLFGTLLNYFQDSPLSLWGPFLRLIRCGLGLTVPEDVVLVSAGALGEMDERRWTDVSLLM